jgi:hypothetical protein
MHTSRHVAPAVRQYVPKAVTVPTVAPVVTADAVRYARDGSRCCCDAVTRTVAEQCARAA